MVTPTIPQQRMAAAASPAKKATIPVPPPPPPPAKRATTPTPDLSHVNRRPSSMIQGRPLTTNIDDAAVVSEMAETDKIELVAPIIPPGTNEKKDMTAEQKESLGPLVTAIVPLPFTLKRDDGEVVEYGQGICEMPESDAGHWFARARGVKVYEPNSKKQES